MAIMELVKYVFMGAGITMMVYFIFGAPFIVGLYSFIFGLEEPWSTIFWIGAIIVIALAVIGRRR